MTLPRPAQLSALALLIASLVGLGHGVSHAASHSVIPKAAAAGLDSSPEWHELNAGQKKVLMPLAPHWGSMDESSRAKWVNVADRFDKLTPADKQRVQDRMSQWAKLPAQERGEARLRFQQSRQLTADQRQQKWAAYQALSAEDRRDLARQAQRKAKPVFLADGIAGPREARQAFSSKRPVASDASAKKSNVVPNAPGTTTPAQTLVRPTMVKAGAGATTSLLTQRPTPPQHQHTGLPKIAATKGFVDPVTLLPKKGAQSAAMASLPNSAAGEARNR
jgi:hypothetical protein